MPDAAEDVSVRAPVTEDLPRSLEHRRGKERPDRIARVIAVRIFPAVIVAGRHRQQVTYGYLIGSLRRASSEIRQVRQRAFVYVERTLVPGNADGDGGECLSYGMNVTTVVKCRVVLKRLPAAHVDVYSLDSEVTFAHRQPEWRQRRRMHDPLWYRSPGAVLVEGGDLGGVPFRDDVTA